MPSFSEEIGDKKIFSDIFFGAQELYAIIISNSLETPITPIYGIRNSYTYLQIDLREARKKIYDISFKRLNGFFFEMLENLLFE